MAGIEGKPAASGPVSGSVSGAVGNGVAKASQQQQQHEPSNTLGTLSRADAAQVARVLAPYDLGAALDAVSVAHHGLACKTVAEMCEAFAAALEPGAEPRMLDAALRGADEYLAIAREQRNIARAFESASNVVPENVPVAAWVNEFVGESMDRKRRNGG